MILPKSEQILINHQIYIKHLIIAINLIKITNTGKRLSILIEIIGNNNE